MTEYQTSLTLWKPYMSPVYEHGISVWIHYLTSSEAFIQNNLKLYSILLLQIIFNFVFLKKEFTRKKYICHIGRKK